MWKNEIVGELHAHVVTDGRKVKWVTIWLIEMTVLGVKFRRIKEASTGWPSAESAMVFRAKHRAHRWKVTGALPEDSDADQEQK